jgi:hypothetical protein
MKDSDKLTMVILSDEQIRECLVDNDVVLDLDDLPKVVRQSYATAGCTVKTFKFDRTSNGWSGTEYWDASDLTIDEDEIVYVEINRWEPQDGRLVYHGNRDITRTLGRLENKCGLVAPTVVGLKTAFLKTKQFEKGNFISLEEYVKRELAANAPTTFYKYDKDQYSTVRLLDKHIDCPDATDIIKLAETQNNDEISQWIDSLNRQLDNPYIAAEMTEDLYLQECLDDFFQKYEMLTYVSHWEIRQEETNPKIARYIGGTVKENINDDD